MAQDKSWLETLKAFTKPSVLRMLFLGFSAGIPILLIFSSLSLWLREAGVDRSAVTFFSWAALGYSFKFVWAPVVDSIPLPFLTKKMGRRRSWLLVAQFAIIVALLLMSLIDPAAAGSSLVFMAFAAALLGFSSATQDIVIDAYRIESDSIDMQAILSSTYIAGYRVGMLVAGAGALYLASFLGSSKETYVYSAWMWTYIAMAGFMGIGVATTLCIPEPQNSKREREYSNSDYARFVSLFVVIVACFVGCFYFTSEPAEFFKEQLNQFGSSLSGLLVEGIRLALAVGLAIAGAKVLISLNMVNRKMVEATYVEPVRDFFTRYGKSTAILLLALVGFYRISDIVLGVISNVFYQDLNFSKNEIATVVKTFGLFMTIAGGFLGGLLAVRFGIMRILFLGAVLSAVTNLLFMALAYAGYNLPLLYVVISADNLSAGLASAAFVAFLSSLTNVSFTAVQYAIFSSLMTLFPKLLGGYSGSMVDSIGYSNFFIVTTLMGAPVLWLVWLADKKLNIKDSKG